MIIYVYQIWYTYICKYSQILRSSARRTPSLRYPPTELSMLTALCTELPMLCRDPSTEGLIASNASPLAPAAAPPFGG